VANYLTSLGHKRIGYIAGPPGFRSASSVSRVPRSLAARRIRFPKNSSSRAVHLRIRRAGGEKLLALNPRPTAIFASNDEMAAGVYRVANKLGLSIPVICPSSASTTARWLRACCRRSRPSAADPRARPHRR
jgi:LacI family transcriptional regulator